MSNQESAKRTATQRLEDAEIALVETHRALESIARDLGLVRDALKLMGNKMDAMTKASVAGEPMTDETLSLYMIANNVQELKQRVVTLIEQGFLVATDEVATDSFVVGEEVNEFDEVKNPRLQFGLSSLSEDVRAKFPGTKAGDVIDFGPGKLRFKVSEIYKISTPAPAVPTPEVTPEAPAAEAVLEVAPESTPAQ